MQSLWLSQVICARMCVPLLEAILSIHLSVHAQVAQDIEICFAQYSGDVSSFFDAKCCIVVMSLGLDIPNECVE